MSRGEPPSALHFDFANKDYQLFYTKCGEFRITELNILPEKIIKPDENKNANVSFLVIIKRLNETVFKRKIHVGDLSIIPNLETIKKSPLWNHQYSEANLFSLYLNIDIIYREKILS